MFWALLSWALLAAVGRASGCSEDLLEPDLDYSSFLQHSLEPRRAKETYSLFVKFHKVAGTTWRDFVDHITGVSLNCSNLCGKPYLECETAYHTDPLFAKLCELDMDARHCDQPLHSCTFHQSLAVIRQAVSGRTLTAKTSDLVSLQNLWPDDQRLALLYNVDWARVWLPSTFGGKRLLTTTLLREPKERIRSYYYYIAPSTHEGFRSFLESRRDYVAGNMTQEAFENESWPLFLQTCCEYEAYLGDGSVEKAKLTLATQFNLVGITERMSEGLVSLGRLYGLTPWEVGRLGKEISRDLDNGQNKLDWAADELLLATYVSKKSQAVYDFAKELFQQQAMSLFGTEEELHAAVAAFETFSARS